VLPVMACDVSRTGEVLWHNIFYQPWRKEVVGAARSPPKPHRTKDSKECYRRDLGDKVVTRDQSRAEMIFSARQGYGTRGRLSGCVLAPL
jgi:hypothetical protein